MRILFLIPIVFCGIIALHGGVGDLGKNDNTTEEVATDPFATAHSRQIIPESTVASPTSNGFEFENEYLRADTSNLDLAKQWVSAEMLKAFDELPIADGKLLDSDNPSWRIFVSKTRDRHVLIKVHASSERPWKISAKKIRNRDGQWTKENEFNLALTVMQQEILDWMINESRFFYLTSKDYRIAEDLFGGDIWIYEIPVPGSFRIITRRMNFCRISDETFPLLGVSHERYYCETCLQTMTMMLWMLVESRDCRHEHVPDEHR